MEYRATTAQWHADRSARWPKPAKLVVNLQLVRQDVLDASPKRIDSGDLVLMVVGLARSEPGTRWTASPADCKAWGRAPCAAACAGVGRQSRTCWTAPGSRGCCGRRMQHSDWEATHTMR
ncbi:Protein of unknown function (plasmid) [Azospirillum lipoferum 4B]|uniref:Uncharacterized protein n=1 Tax=Azospirillum lipoferum (strain 4B) TaxID=862719 RepID=G7ZD58_AZOL4|nr:Protein of unknown function [Azospirillum lipoferum 4B]